VIKWFDLKLAGIVIKWFDLKLACAVLIMFFA
jgi:hypothetical protein